MKAVPAVDPGTGVFLSWIIVVFSGLNNQIFIMRNAVKFLSVLLLAGAVACNSGSTGNAGSDSTGMADMPGMDHSQMTASSATLPEIPAGAHVYFKNLKDGQTVTSPFKVEMGVDGMSVDTAGVVRAGSGHHHLLIDAGDSLAAGTVVPKDSQHLHFGNAQTETELSLAPGTHRLTLQFADGLHRSYGGALANSITVKVK